MHISLTDIISYSLAEVNSVRKESIEDIEVSGFVFDTRTIISAEHEIFLCLAKYPRDIQQHISKAHKKGVRYFIVGRNVDVSSFDNTIFLIVDDVLLAIQRIATRHRAKMEAKVIGITGSNGKTIIKEWLSQILEAQYTIVKSPASYNSQLGVPLSVLKMESQHEFAIFEAGISEPEEMARLQPIIDCQYGILTNLGDAHDEGFTSRDKKLHEKLVLFQNVEFLIYEETDFVTKQKLEVGLDVKLINWSEKKDRETTYQISIERGESYTSISISGKKKFLFDFPLQDKASTSNIIHIAILCLELGINMNHFRDRVQFLESVSMRLVLKRALRNCLVVDDSYNADLVSLENALDFSLLQKKDRKLHLIMSDFDQINQGENYSKKLNSLIKKYQVDRVSYIGTSATISSKDSEVKYYNNRKELEISLDHEKPRNQLILLKGARRFQLNELISSFSEKFHKTQLFVDMNAIHQNIKAYRRLMKTSTKIMAVIKAGAYGSDSIHIAKSLVSSGVEYLAVAYYDEALELRKEGIESNIMVMNPDPLLTKLAIEHRLELEIYSISQLKNILAQARTLDNEKRNKLSLHLKIESGMHRLGLEEKNEGEILELLKDSDLAEIKSIFSHFSSSEDPLSDDFTKHQHQYFLTLAQRWKDKLENQAIETHICNSSAAARFPEFHHDMIRLGIGLYGYVDIQGAVFAHRLVTYIAQIKEIQKGDFVGYSNSFQAENDMKIATLCIGYADGISRKLGNGNFHFLSDGKKLSTIGNISMDTCSVDITGLEIKVGHEIVVFDSKKTFAAFAAASEKTDYEAITNLGQRVVRNYVKN